MTVTNQKPVILEPFYTSKAHGQFDVEEYMKESMIRPLFTPQNQNHPATISGQNGNLDEDALLNLVMDCCGDTMNPAAELLVKELFGDTLVYFDKNTNLAVSETFAIQSANAANPPLPYPTSTILYSPATDVIPMSKKFLGGQCDYNAYFATMAFYTRATVLGFYFANETAFDDFKTYVANITSAMTTNLTTETQSMLADFQTLRLNGLTESILLRNDHSENNEDYSFARLIMTLLMTYRTTMSSAQFGVLPFNLSELFCPKAIVFVNVSRHSMATAKEIADEWEIIKKSQSLNFKMVSNRKLTKMTSVVRSAHAASAMAATQASNRQQQAARARNMRFKKTAPSTQDLTRYIKKVLNKMANVARSENVYKTVKTSYNRANRRDPDDFNKPGKIVSNKYSPDIHLYIDTSGSISEAQYQSAMKTCIRIAKKLNINLYFNSFSHVLSQCTKIVTKDKTVPAIYAAFQRVPKVTGGTDFAQIWEYINDSPKRQKELSIMITDFEWSVPNNYHVNHPKNLYYSACANTNWQNIQRYAEYFCKSAMHIDPQIRNRLFL